MGTINLPAQSLLIYLMISPPKQLKTSVNYAWVLQVLAMLDRFFTELFLDLCSREEILNVEMELEADQFIKLGNSTMKISSKNTTNQDLCQWPTQDQTPTEPNFSSLWKKLLG